MNRMIDLDYWGSWKGDVLKAIVVDGAKSWKELQEITQLKTYYLNQALSELYSAGVLRKKYDGTYEVIGEIYFKYQKYFSEDQCPLRDLFESLNELWYRKKDSFINKNCEFYKVFNHRLRNVIYQKVFSLNYPEKTVQASVGMFKWATIPSIIIRDPRVSTGIQSGVYIAYLYYPSKKSLFLTICAGSQNYELENEELVNYRDVIKKPTGFKFGFEEWVLNSLPNHKLSNNVRKWIDRVIYFKRYAFESIPSDRILERDLNSALKKYEKYIESIDAEKYFRDLSKASKSENVENIIQKILNLSEKNIEKIIQLAVAKIKLDKYDGSVWSSLAFSISNHFKNYEKVTKIFEELVNKEPNNAAYHNNLGVNYLQRKQYDLALSCFAQAYAIDVRQRGHKKASNLPAWKNLKSTIPLSIESSKVVQS